MSIEKIRSSLNSDDLKTFNDVISQVKLSDNVSHDVIDFNDVKNFIIKSTFQSYPKTGLVMINDGVVAKAICY